MGVVMWGEGDDVYVVMIFFGNEFMNMVFCGWKWMIEWMDFLV